MAGIVRSANWMAPQQSVGPGTLVGPVGVQAAMGPGALGQFYNPAAAVGPLPLEEHMPPLITYHVRARPFTGDNPLHLMWKNGCLMFSQRAAPRANEMDTTELMIDLAQMNNRLAKVFFEQVTQPLKPFDQAGIADVKRDETEYPAKLDKLRKLRGMTPEQLMKEMVPEATSAEQKRFYEDCWALCPEGILNRWNLAGVLYLTNNEGNFSPGMPDQSYKSRPAWLNLTIAKKGKCNLLEYWPEANTNDRLFLILKRQIVAYDAAGEAIYGPYAYVPWSGLSEAPPADQLQYRDLSGVMRTAHYIPLGMVLDQRGMPFGITTNAVGAIVSDQGWRALLGIKTPGDNEGSRQATIAAQAALTTAFQQRVIDRDMVFAS